MATTQEQLAQQIGLTGADMQEYKDTGSYGSAAQAKINAYRASLNNTPNQAVSNPNPATSTPATTNQVIPTGHIGTNLNQANGQNQSDLENTIKSGNFTASQRAEYNREKGNNNRARDLALTSKQGVGNLTTSITPGEFNQMKNAGITDYDTHTGNGHITADLQGGTAENFKQNVQNLGNSTAINTNTANPNGEGKPVDTTTIKKETTPNGEITTTSTPKNTEITSTTPWDKTGKTINDLEGIVQARYGNATLQGNSVIGKDENGVPSRWTIGPDGNPHKEQNFQNSNDFLNILSQGGQIDPKYNGDPRYIEAKHTYDTLNSYKGASADVLYSAMATNKLVPGSYAYNDLVKMSGGIETPEMLQAKARYEQQMKTNAINRDIDINTGTNKPPVNPTETISDNIVKTKGMDYATEFQKDIMNNPEINSLSTDLNNTNQSIKELEQSKSKTLKKIIADHPGISMGMALGIAQNENNDIDTELQGLYNKQATQQANLTYKTDLASKMFDYKVKQNEEDRADQKILDERAYQEQQKQEDRAYQEQETAKKLDQEYQYKYGDINSTNPTLRNIAIQNAVADMYDRYKDIPGLESVSVKEQKVQDYMSGKTTGTPMSGSEAIARVENEIRNSSRYKDYLAEEKAKMTPKPVESWDKLDDGSLYNRATGEVKAISGGITGNWQKLDDGSLYNKTTGEVKKLSNNIGSINGNTDINPTDFIASKEGFRDTAYKDSTGKRTIGYGSTSINGQPVQPGQTISEEDARADLDNRVNNAQFTRVVKVPLTDSQKAALASFEYNLGGNIWAGSAKPIIDKINAGDFNGAAAYMRQFNKAYNPNTGNKEVLDGLTTRRNEEANLLMQTGGNGNSNLTDADISKFNNPTFKPASLKNPQDIAKYNAYQQKMNSVFNDPNTNFYDVIGLSKGSGKGNSEERGKIGKYSQALSGLDTLTGLVNSQDTGPIIGRLKQLNPYSTDASQFKAVIAGLVPTVARGVFNEVGVLTDADVERYLGTLPTLTKTSDQNKLVVGALLSTLRNGMRGQLDSMARSGVDVSKFKGSMVNMDNTISRLEKSVQINPNGNTPTPSSVKTQNYTSKSGKTYNINDYR